MLPLRLCVKHNSTKPVRGSSGVNPLTLSFNLLSCDDTRQMPPCGLIRLEGINMRRVTPRLLAALLTFVIGVVVSTLSGIILPRFAHLIRPHSTTVDRSKDSGCNEWEIIGPANDGLGWDLTYMSLLRKNGICPGDIFCEFSTQKPQQPVNKYFAEWKGAPIVSSMLVELPDGHAAMFALWLIRTKDQAYWWYFHPDHPEQLGMQPLPTHDYDRAFETIRCWQQLNLENKNFFTGDGDGYIGFLSLYNEGKSRQMLITPTDLFDPYPKEWNKPSEVKLGRLWKTLSPIHAALREQRKQTAQVDE